MSRVLDRSSLAGDVTDERDGEHDCSGKGEAAAHAAEIGAAVRSGVPRSRDV
jgi:hypothetical protein